MKVVVTGGSGKAGRAVVWDLVQHGHQVINVDIVAPAETVAPLQRADLTDYGQTVECLRGADAVVHLAAIPAPRITTSAETFRINVTSTYNVFSAAALLGLPRVVWASSETTLGLPFGRRPQDLLEVQAQTGHHLEPDYAPIDEAHPLRPHSSYALSKVLGEEMAQRFATWSGIPFISLRFSHVHHRQDYEALRAAWDDPETAQWNLWGYVDARDVAQACRLALTADVSGAESFIVAAADTKIDRPSRELMAQYFSDVPIRGELGEHETLLSIQKARQMLGYAPEHSWRHEVDPPG